MIRVCTALVLIIGTGLVHGAWTDRWRPAPALVALAQRFESVPMTIGDWKATALELPADERAMAGAVGCLYRRYTNPNRGISLSVLLLGGLPGKISTHTPDVCYPGAGYSLDTPSPVRFSDGASEHPAEFRTSTATRGGTSPSVLRLFWSWNASSGWSAPDEPRWHFATATALCKLYVIRETSGVAVDPKDDSCKDFLNVFLPELDKLVFSAPK